MSITQRFTTRRVRAALVTTVAAGAGLAGLLGMSGAAQASTAGVATHGYVVIDSCTGVSGKITYSPGMRNSVLKNVNAVLTGTTSGCSDIFNGPMSGTGTITAIMSGKADVDAANFSGTFTINWPAGSGYNPSNGTLSVTDSSGVETMSGSVSSGFDTGTAFYLQYVPTGKHGTGKKGNPVTWQTYTDTAPLTLSRNEG